MNFTEPVASPFEGCLMTRMSKYCENSVFRESECKDTLIIRRFANFLAEKCKKGAILGILGQKMMNYWNGEHSSCR